MNILTVNTGSSSVRLALFSENTRGLKRSADTLFRADEEKPEKQLKIFVKKIGQKIEVIAHRIVHGGMRFTDSCLINSSIEKEIETLSPLAPLHNPISLTWIKACRAVFGKAIPQVGVFDTSFFSSLPEISKMYALPKNLCEKYGIRRYGFHGLAHRALSQRWKELRPDILNGGKVISLQLGSGCSITAVKEGRPIDTSMGFSPLEGLMMSTRPGDIDPGILMYLQTSKGFSVDEIDSLLNKTSGLFGVSGVSGDMRTLLQSHNPYAKLAVDIYCYRARKYIGAYMAALGGADGILFGGGVGENAPLIRKNILDTMQWCGVQLDESANSYTIGKEERISAKNSTVDVWTIHVDESTVLAEEARALIR
jgi:acetate kinase